MENFNWSDWLTSAGYTLLAALGGLLGYIMREHDKGNPLNGWRMAAETAGSGFVGFLVMLLCFAMGFDPLWSCLLYTSPSPRDRTRSRMPSSA